MVILLFLNPIYHIYASMSTPKLSINSQRVTDGLLKATDDKQSSPVVIHDQRVINDQGEFPAPFLSLLYFVIPRYIFNSHHFINKSSELYSSSIYLVKYFTRSTIEPIFISLIFSMTN